MIRETTSDEEFLEFVETIGDYAPMTLSDRQLVGLVATILGNYVQDDVDRLGLIVQQAANLVIDVQANHYLDLAVGPEDGVH